MYSAIIVALAVFIGVAGHEFLGNSMLSRPIVVAPLTGLLLGDINTGLLVGASLETIFMGVVNIGISSTAEPALAAGLATSFSINLGGSIGATIPLAFPLAVLGLQLMNLIFSFVIGPFAPVFERLAEKGKDKQIARLHYGLWILHYGLYALIPFFAVLFGSGVVERILHSIPGVVMNGLTVAGNLLPAVGMAMLLQMLWDKKIIVFFILGLVMVGYLKLPLVAVAVVSCIIAIIIAQRDFQVKKLEGNRTNPQVAIESATNEEEDFFK